MSKVYIFLPSRYVYIYTTKSGFNFSLQFFLKKLTCITATIKKERAVYTNQTRLGITYNILLYYMLCLVNCTY